MHLRTVILSVIALLGIYAAWLIVSGLVSGTLAHHYRSHFADIRRERLFLASLSFFLTFALVRLLTHAIHAHRGPFHDITLGGRHIHHLVWGISLLLLVGYGWLNQVGTGEGAGSAWMSRGMSLLYGVGAALTLDEFALWLNLSDVYWLPQGRESVDAVLLFGSLLSAGLWGGPFLRTMTREGLRVLADR